MKFFVGVTSTVYALIAGLMINYLVVYYPSEVSLDLTFTTAICLFVSLSIWGFVLLARRWQDA